MMKDGMNEKGYNPYRLQILASFLAHHKPIHVEFNMGKFSDIPFETLNFTEMDEYERSQPTCGTVGCAAGFATLIWPKKLGEEFMDYSTRTLIATDADSTETIWDWCFAQDWSDYDNTPFGAAQRIQYLLDNGDMPKDFDSHHILSEYIPLYQDIEVKDVPIPV